MMFIVFTCPRLSVAEHSELWIALLLLCCWQTAGIGPCPSFSLYFMLRKYRSKRHSIFREKLLPLQIVKGKKRLLLLTDGGFTNGGRMSAEYGLMNSIEMIFIHESFYGFCTNYSSHIQYSSTSELYYHKIDEMVIKITTELGRSIKFRIQWMVH